MRRKTGGNGETKYEVGGGYVDAAGLNCGPGSVGAARDGEVQYVEVSDENADVYVLNFDTQGAADEELVDVPTNYARSQRVRADIPETSVDPAHVKELVAIINARFVQR
jgi:hypothetical protein